MEFYKKKEWINDEKIWIQLDAIMLSQQQQQ